MARGHDLSHTEVDLLVQAAESYYIENKTQSQIARQLGISPSTISRLLSRARDEGIVRISIIRPQGRHSSLEQALRERFAISAAIVVSVPPSVMDHEAIHRIIGTVAAPYIDALVKPGMLVGVGRGRTLAALTEALWPFATPRRVTIVQVMGEYDAQQSPTRAAELTRLIAEMYAGTSYFLNAPALVEVPALAELLLHTPGVSQVLPFYERLDMMLVGIGPLRGSPLAMNGLLSPEHIIQLEDAGALGDICGHFFAEDGRFVDDAYPGRVIAIGEAQLRRCPCIVGLAAGDGKVPALRALLEAHMLHVLVTDERTALQILSL